MGTEGAIHSVAVRENAYYAKEFYNGPVIGLVALDAAGQVVYKRSLPR